MTFNELIAQGIRDTLDERRAEYRPTAKNHRFSVAYKIKREYIIRFCPKSVPLSVRSIKYILNALISALFVLAGFGLFKGLSGRRAE